MLQAQITDLDSGKLLLRWHDAPEQPSRETAVDVVESHLREATISSLLQVHERTEVQLIGRGYQEAGVVRSCRREGGRFILIIGITSAPEMETAPFQRDPGVLAVEDFITEEEADRILDELNGELGSETNNSSERFSFAQLCAIQQFWATARLLQFSRVLEQLCSMSRVHDRILWLNKV